MARVSQKRSNEFDSDSETETNASKIPKTTGNTFWLYVKAESGNICKMAVKDKSFKKALAEITKKCPLEMDKIKLFFSKEMLGISCRSENQQKSLLELKTINGNNVTVTLYRGPLLRKKIKSSKTISK